MNISYRTRQALRRGFSLAATIIAVIVLVLLCLLVWLQRFLVYTDQGVSFDFDRSRDFGQSLLPQAEKNLPNVTIRFEDSPYQEGLTYLSGYYIREGDLMDDPQAVQEKLAQLPAGTPVLLDIKGYRGYFFYSTSVGDHTSGLYNMEKMDSLLRWLAQSDLYVIARMSSLRDFVTVWDDNSCGLTTTSGNLYTDRGDYGLGYWLDPTNSKVQNYLMDVVNELKNKGFDEVVLQNFCFPNSEDIAFKGDRQEALNQCAQKLISGCTDSSFAISFSSDDPGFVMPEGRCRLYLENIPAEDAQAAWEQAAVSEKRQYLVFLADNSDTRYDIENGILRPLG